MLLLEFNLILLVLTSLFVNLIGAIYYRHYTGNDKRNWLIIFGEILFIILVGPWFSLFTVFFFTVVILRVFGYLFFTDPKFKSINRRNLGRGECIRSSFFRFIIVLLTCILIVFYAIVILGRILGSDVIEIISISSGFIIAVYWTKKNGLPLYNKLPDFRIKKKATISVLLAIIIISSFSMVFTPRNSENIEDSFDLRTMSFNILYSGEDGSLQSWPERCDDVSDYIESLDLDVFGLQEVFKIQGDYLNSTLDNRNYNWVGIGREIPDTNGNTGEHDAIFYDVDRFSLIDNGTLWFSDTPHVSSRTWLTERIKRTYQWVHLQDKVTGGQFFFYNTHFGFYPEFHIKASIQLNGDISDRTGNLPVIVTGDFNMPCLFPFYSFLEGFGTKPIYNAIRILNGYIPPVMIDHIFTTPDIHISSCEAKPEANLGPQWLSDHDPVMLICELPIK